MIASKPILEKLSAKDRKTIDAHLADYRQHIKAEREASREKGRNLERNMRRRHIEERAALARDLPTEKTKTAIHELAERHAREVSEAPHKEKAFRAIARSHKKKADKALSKCWPMLIEPAEELLAEYQKRDEADRERLGMSAPGVTAEIGKVLLALRKMADQTDGIKPWNEEKILHLGVEWLAGNHRMTDKGQDEPVKKIDPPLIPEDDPEFFTKNPNHPRTRREQPRDILPSAADLMG